LLTFFFYWHDADRPDDTDVGLVSFHDATRESLRRLVAPAELHPGGRFRELDLTPQLEWTIQGCDDTNYELEFWANLTSRVAEAQGLEHGWGLAPVHRMLGYPELLQSNGLADGDVLLLQVESDSRAGMMWGDGGTVYYVINESDLKARDFGKAWAIKEEQ
jgi:hypothetical protein